MSNFITNQFKPYSANAWKQKIQVDLKGADYNETLLTETIEGITIKPFYHSDDFTKLNVPTTKEDFKICEKILITTEEEANKKALNANQRGAESLKFIAEKTFNFETLLNQLTKKEIEFHFNFKFLDKDFIEKLSTFLKQETVFFNVDIIGKLAKTGNWFNSLEEDFNTVTQLIKNQHHTTLSVNASVYQNAGANTVQQVAYALAHANEYLNKYGKDIANKIQFNFSVGSNYFFEISKIRAFKYLYQLITKEYNSPSVAKIYAEPTLRNKTLYDYNVNMLRTTTESMSAILGGANTVCNADYDTIFHNSNEFGSRIARNQLLVLKEESYFKNAQQIATNTNYIESITQQIAEKALEIFKTIEKGGGFLAQLKEGTIQRKITENAQKEQEQFNEGKLVLLGTNKYPNPLDKMKNDLQKNPFLEKKQQKTLTIPILPKRLAEGMEQKRLQDEA